MNTEIKINDVIKPGEIVARVQICPFGEFERDGKRQVCDSKAFTQLIANWDDGGAKEILMDFEHASEVPKIDSDTRAAAWISNLAIDDELGLVGDFKFTDLGAEAVSNRRLRFLSPVWPLDGDGRPTTLKSVALTNTPNISVRPILNKAETGKTNVEEKKENPNMDKIKEILGLAPEASEADVLNAVTAIVAKNKECERKAQEAEKAALEKEAGEYAEANKAKLDPAVIKAQYIANKEACKALVDAIKPAGEQIVLNKGKTPNKDTQPEVLNKLAACKTPAERCNFVMQHAAELAALNN